MAILAGTLAVLLVALALPGPARASKAGRDIDDALNFQADPGEANNVTISWEAATSSWLISDAYAITLYFGCAAVNGTQGKTVRCAGTPTETIYAYGFDGNDRIAMNAGAPLVGCGGSGADEITGGSGNDALFGGPGEDTIVMGDGADYAYADPNTIKDPDTGTDVCGDNSSYTPAHNTLDGGGGNDLLYGDAGPETMYGGPETDVLLGNGGNDDEHGGDGDDAVNGGPGNDVLAGDDGQDVIGGGDGNDVESGGASRDLLGVTQSSGSTLLPDSGDDTLSGDAGDDTLLGGPGFLVFAIAPGESPPIDPATVNTVEGRDVLTGGPGTDTVSYENRPVPVAVSLDGAANDGSGEGDNVQDAEILVGGSAGDDLTGSGAGETLDGGPGGDTLHGAGGDDTLRGGSGDDGQDTIDGGEGADTADGGPGVDALSGGPGSDTLKGDAGDDTIDGGADGDQLSGGAGADTVAGGSGDDTVRGGAEALVGADGGDTLRGDDGTDTLVGGDGADFLAGGGGPDTLEGDAGIDTADYRGESRAVSVTLDGVANDGADGESDAVQADVESTATGSGADTLVGSAAANVLDAGAGDDFIDDPGGADQMQGGPGRDVVRSRDGAADTVACGPQRDFAIVDADDRVDEDCERVDDGEGVRPVLGREAVVSSRSGRYGLRLPGMTRSVPLGDRLVVPMRTEIDSQSARVRLATTSGRRRGKRAAELTGSAFSVRQRRAGGAAAEVRLAGAVVGAMCRVTPGTAIRALSVKTRGALVVRGRRSRAAATRATFTVTDRCDGTVTRVRSGTVRVLAPGGVRRVLHAGQSFRVAAGR